MKNGRPEGRPFVAARGEDLSRFPHRRNLVAQASNQEGRLARNGARRLCIGTMYPRRSRHGFNGCARQCGHATDARGSRFSASCKSGVTYSEEFIPNLRAVGNRDKKISTTSRTACQGTWT